MVWHINHCLFSKYVRHLGENKNGIINTFKLANDIITEKWHVKIKNINTYSWSPDKVLDTLLSNWDTDFCIRHSPCHSQHIFNKILSLWNIKSVPQCVSNALKVCNLDGIFAAHWVLFIIELGTNCMFIFHKMCSCKAQITPTLNKSHTSYMPRKPIFSYINNTAECPERI